MGQDINHKSWFNKAKRKVLVISYNDFFLKKTIKALSKEDLPVNDSLGYCTHNVKYSNLDLELWYLATKNRHFWMHHYPGCQGVILNFSFDIENQDERIVFDALNIFFDENLCGIPILVFKDKNCRDKTDLFNKLNKEWESQRTSPEHKNIQADVKFFQGNIDEGIEGNSSAFEWLATTMKPLA